MHARNAIRDAVYALVDGIAGVGTAYNGRAIPVGYPSGNPSVFVFTREEAGSRDGAASMGAAPGLNRDLQISCVILTRATDDDDASDTIAEAIEDALSGAMVAGGTLAALLIDLRYDGFSIANDTEGDTPRRFAELRYTGRYRTAEGAAGTAII